MFNNRAVELIATLFVRFVLFLFICFVFIIICRYTCIVLFVEQDLEKIMHKNTSD